ncbi:HBS1-like protein [Colletotrichum chlorophyti]|uniref:Elongation factor 1 alpha-like protein n=1 Tax=Colletotrichum chlorophyti TaxID=708187 RepID=A0A1Q8RLT9_9PEZI|nr:HBS1-like protein [Colletotrichum chlorophyti]
MSRHQAVSDLDYDDAYDEYEEDDYEEDFQEKETEGDQLSPEDREIMDEKTAVVQSLLGPEGDKISVQQIQDSLWYYYYDVDKTVSYLQKKFIAPPSPSKQEPKKAKDVREYPAPRIASLSPASYFHGIPWMNVPKSRQAVLVPPRSLPGGLLGGGDGPKLSKLQALAAARKKKTDATKTDDKVDRAEKRMSTLALNDASKENERPGSSMLAKRQKLSLSSDSSSQIPIPIQQAQQDDVEFSGMDIDPSREPLAGDDVQGEDECFVVPSSRPSAFAQTLFGSSQDTAASQTYNLPYLDSSTFVPSAFTQPSPDDIVLAAQAKAGNKFDAAAAKSAAKKVSAKPAAKSTGTNTPINEMQQLQVDDSAIPKNKKLDVVKEFEQSKNKRSASFVVVGHVDAGKSTLMGRLLLELKHVEQHVIDRYRRQAEKIGKESFAYAWVMDQREEEREHGVTIDIATNQFETDKTRFTILDAPGHKDFVPNMIAGASQADFAILVIDANTGAFEKGLKGQTREHALLLRSLGVQQVIVAVNKLDMVEWSKDRFDEISEQVTGFMKGNGFQLKKITFVPMSGLNGDNLLRKPDDDRLSWYTGPTLIEALEASEPMTRALKGPFRMSISEIFRSQNSQLTVNGRIESGTIQIGEELIVQPSGESASIRSIEVDSELQDWAVAGQNVNIGLYGIDPVHVRDGDIICTKAAPIETSDTLTLKVLAYDHLLPMPVDVHRGRLNVAGGIQKLLAVLDKTTGETVKKNPKVVQPGKVARIVVKLEKKVPLEAGQRVVLRSAGETIAAGLLE